MSANQHLLRAAGTHDGQCASSSKPARSKVLLIKESLDKYHKLLSNAQVTVKQIGGKPSSDAKIPFNVCVVCKNDLPYLSKEPITAVTSCEHTFCYECALRLIFIKKKKDCPKCDQVMTKVILTWKKLESDQDVKRFLTACKKKRIISFHDILHLETDDLYDKVKNLLWFQCAGCTIDFSRLIGVMKNDIHQFAYISKHLKIKHDSFMCDLCFHNLEQFSLEFTFYTGLQALQRHKDEGEVIEGKPIFHPQCTLCDDPEWSYHFDIKALVDHCNKSHLSCHVCNSTDTFFLDADAVNEHILKQHFTCSLCLTDNKVVGFSTDVELKSHATQEHPNKLESTADDSANFYKPAQSSKVTNVVGQVIHVNLKQGSLSISGRGKARHFNRR